jgi:DNA-binding HxlR family transcriptional regulator
MVRTVTVAPLDDTKRALKEQLNALALDEASLLRQPPEPSMDPETRAKLTKNLNRLIHDEIYSIQSPIERAMELIGDKYSFQIIHLLNQHVCLRFIELENKITGISPRTLSARLKHLDRYGLIERHQYATIPPKVEYTLTQKGKDLSLVLSALDTWTNRWFPSQADTLLPQP